MGSKNPSRWARVRDAIALRRMNQRAAGSIDGEQVGYAIAVIGGIIAVVTLLAVLFVPVATFTTLDAEMGAGVGVVMLVVGVGIKSASS